MIVIAGERSNRSNLFILKEKSRLLRQKTARNGFKGQKMLLK